MFMLPGLQSAQRRVWLLIVLFTSLVGCDNKTVADHLTDAQNAIAQGELRVAVIELKNAIQKEPTSVPARSLLGQMHFEFGDYPSALKELERAVDLGATDDTTLVTLLRTKNSLGNYSEVVGELEERSSLTPEYAVTLAQAYLYAGDMARAKPLYEQGAHLDEGLMGLAQIAQTENDIERAYRYLKQLTEQNPQHRDGWLYRAEIELGRNQPAEALSSFQTAAQQPGGDVSGRLGIVRAHLLAQDNTAAQKEVDAIIAKHKEFPPAQYLKGLISFRQGNLEEAEVALRVVQQFARDHLPTLYLMGAIKAQQGQLGQAEDSLQRYLSHDPDNVSVRKLIASVYSDQGKFDDVVDVLKPVADQHSDPQLWAMLGSAQLRSGAMAEATEAFQKAVEIAPDMAPFRNQLALSLLSTGDNKNAMAQLNSAIDVDGDQYQSDYILVMVRLRDGDLEGATEAVERVIEKSRDIPIGYNLKGAIALARDDQAGAIASFEQALEVAPGFFPAAQNLARIAEQEGDAQKAKAIYEASWKAGGSEAATLALVDLAVRGGDVEGALTRLNEAVKTFPNSVRARLGLMRLLVASSRLEQAEAAADLAVTDFPNVPDILLLKAEVDIRTGDRNDAQTAAAQLQTLLDQYKNNGQLLAAAGALQLQLGNLTLARQNLELAFESGRTPPGALLNMARLEIAEGNPSRAQAIIKELEEKGAAGEELELLKGDVLAAAGRADEAYAHFKALAETGSRAGTTNYALMAMSRGERETAQKVIRQWVQDNPEDTGMKLLLANLQIQSGETQRAKAQYESLLPSDDPVVLNNLAWIYMNEGDDRAVTMARQANEVAPNNPDIEDTLGWILVQSGSLREGLRFLRSSARAKPDNAEVQYHLGVALHKADNAREAKVALQRAVDLGGFSEADEAQALLAELGGS